MYIEALYDTRTRCKSQEPHLPRWEDFQAYVDEREPKMLRAFTAMEVNPAGQLELKHIKSMNLVPASCAFSVQQGWQTD